ncbi:hypothetical protein FSHL1_010337 [Fusarium sambucinum]
MSDEIPNSPIASSLEEMSHISHDDATDYLSSRFGEAKFKSPEVELGSPYRARESPPCQDLSRRPSGCGSQVDEIVQDENSDTDTEGSDSDDGLDITGLKHDRNYHPPPKDDGHSSGDDSDDEEYHGRKRRKISQSSQGLVGSTPASAWNSRRYKRPTRGDARSLRESATSTLGLRSTPSETGSVQSEADTLLASFEEWPLKDVVLKRITEGGKTTFQLQFEWITSPSQPHTNTHECNPHKRQRLPQSVSSAARSSGDTWTVDEEDIVRRMRRDGCSWAEIQRALPHRSQGTIQVRYSTKLKG